MTLLEYVRETHLTYRQLAALLGVNVAQAHRLTMGKRSPSLRAALRIRDLTGGKVGPEDFRTPAAPAKAA